MAFRAGARVLETTTTTGTGAITLAGAVSGYRAFSSVATADGDTFYYVIAGGTEWEEGFGTRTSATTFARTTPLASSSGTLPFNFTVSSKEVWLDIPGRVAQAVGLFVGEIYGLTLSNGTDATNDINIAVGHAADSTNLDVMRLETALGKQLDVAWAVGGTTGTPAGGLDTGTVGNNTYHVHLIKRPDTGVVDALFSLSATAPTMPTNYTLFRRIGSFKRVAGVNTAFRQSGDHFLLVTESVQYSSTSGSTGWGLTDIGVPAGIRVQPIISFTFIASNVSSGFFFQIGDATDSGKTNPYSIVNMDSGKTNGTLPGGLYTNTSSQIYREAANSGTTISTGTLTLRGWFDHRGRFGVL